MFSRSHSGPPTHPSFDLAKATHGRISYLITEGISVFCEFCYAVHSIEYTGLPDYSLVFGVRDDREDLWWDWDSVVMQAHDLSLPTVPVLYRGTVSTEDELRELTEQLSSQSSAFGGKREGVVVRKAGSYKDFSKSLAKWVRKNHVQTDDHWMHMSIKPQRLSNGQ